MFANSSLSTTASRAAADYYPSALHEEALARLAYLAEKGTACGLLLGPRGCGKSLILSRFTQQQRQKGAAVAAVCAAGALAGELLTAIGTAWGADVRVSDELPQIWQMTTDRLRVLSLEQIPALLLVDDLDRAWGEGAAIVDRLQAFTEGTGANLVLIAAAESRGRDLLSPRFLARAELRAELDVWTHEESQGFLQQWQSHRGGENQEFDLQAMAVLHDLAEGIPRRVRQLAELTMLAGSRTEDGPLSEDIVEAAYEELCIGR
ncbi:MAG: AAA family ATPase [Pirellulaceae bacterium]|nr:AAA family ATPase [Pirellulaceae bacterium]